MKENVANILSEMRKEKSFPDSIVLCFIISLLAIDFLPYFKSLEIINPQFLYLSIINFFTGIYLYLYSDLISEDIFKLFKKSTLFKLYLVFIFFCSISYFTAKNTSLVYTKITEILIVFVLFVNLSILLKNKLEVFFKIILIVSVSAFLQAWQQLYNFVIIPNNLNVIDLLGAMKGNTGNVNILAASLTIKIPFLLVGISHYKSFVRIFLIVTLFSVTTIIFLTGSRTPLINIFLIYCIYIFYLLKNSFTKGSFLRILYLAIPTIAAVIFANSILKKSNDLGRYVSLEHRVSQINTDDTSAKTRLDYWHNALQISAKNPIFGVGIGNYQIESIPYEKGIGDGVIVSLHAHNDFLEILAETGLINGIVYLTIFIFIFIINLKNTIIASNESSKSIALLTLMLIVVLGLDSLFNFPMYRPTMAIFFCLILVFTIVNNSVNIISVSNIKIRKTVIISLIIISIATSYSSFLIYKASNLEYMIATDDINANEKGVLTGDEVIKRMPLYPNTFSSSESFYEYAGIYYVREKNYKKAFNCFAKGYKINPYTGRIDYYKYVIANQKGDIDSAFIYAKRAFEFKPRNFSFYRTLLETASIKKDTLEILKTHEFFSSYINNPEVWNVAANNLRNAGYNRESLFKFINRGQKQFPKDESLLKQKKDYSITNFIIEGQKFEALSNFPKALESYQNAIKLDSTNIYALQNIGYYYYNRGQYKTAVNYLVSALKQPGLENGQTEYYLGISYLKINDKKNACKNFHISKDKGFTITQILLNENCQ